MRIAICDDEAHMLSHLSRLCRDWANARGMPLEVAQYESAEAFLFAYEEDKRYGALLLDIQMRAMDGIALARRIRLEDEAVPIVFITGLADHMATGYEVAALHYLLKPVDPEKLHTVLDRALAANKAAEPALLIESDGAQRRIRQRDILYIEALSHHVDIHASDGIWTAKIQLRALEAELTPPAFLRCHRSYLVGLRHVQAITRTDVLLENGQAIPLSRRLYHAVHQAFIRYHKEGF